MSCHDIGRGMNSVVEVVIVMYDNQEITREAAVKIIHAARKGVSWCDGNEPEAVECIDKCRCGRCLKKMETGEPLYSLYNIKDVFIKKRYVEEEISEILATVSLCTECFIEVMTEYTGSEEQAEEERKYIEENSDYDEWHTE